MFYTKAFSLYLILFFSSLALSQLETVSVNATGYGDNPESALNSALTQAIGQVNGRSMESDSLLKTTEKTKNT